MNLSSLLKAKTNELKHVDVKRDNGKPELLLCEDSNAYRRMMQDSFLENYFEVIENDSFATSFVDLTKDEASAIVNLHKTFLECLSKGDNNCDIDSSEILSLLASKIDESIKKLGSKQVFVRLSSRSAKDAPLLLPNFKKKVDFFLKSLKAANANNNSNNSNNSNNNNDNYDDGKNFVLHALQAASIAACAVENGKDALELLCRSKRIQDDLQSFVDGTLHINSNIDINNINSFKLCVREFKNFPLDFELRVFIYEKKLTAITQYNPYIFFPKLKASKEKIEILVLNFVNRLLEKDAIPLSNFVLDLILLEKCKGDEQSHLLSSDVDIDNLSVLIVELNPFGEFAGSSLFSWLTDKPTLMGKSDQIEFRIVNDVQSATPTESMAKDWQEFLE